MASCMMAPSHYQHYIVLLSLGYDATATNLGQVSGRSSSTFPKMYTFLSQIRFSTKDLMREAKVVAEDTELNPKHTGTLDGHGVSKLQPCIPGANELTH